MKKIFLSLLLFLSVNLLFAAIPAIVENQEEPVSIAKSTGNTIGSNSWNTTLINRCGYGGDCHAVQVVDSIAYFGDGAYLEIMNISDPSNPVRLGLIEMPSLIWDVVVSGSYAYVADGDDGLRIIDISNLASPTETGFLGTSTAGAAWDVAISGSYAYVAEGFDGLRIIDVSNPAAPTETGFFDSDSGYTWSVAVSGSYAYVANDTTGLRIIDISDPADPTETGFFDTGNQANGVAISGSYAYVTDGDGGLRIIDISNPAGPTETGFLDTDGCALDVAVSDPYAYVVDNNYGLRIINISDPANPTEVGFFNTDGYAVGIAVSGSYAYVANGFEGLYIIINDLSVNIDLNFPEEYSLTQNYPNPFNPTTAISYQLSVDSNVELSVFDMNGRKIVTLINDYQSVGYYTVNWDASGYSSGIYFYRLKAGDYVETKKMVFMK